MKKYGGKLLRKLSSNISLVDLENNIPHDVIFIRHIMPVDFFGGILTIEQILEEIKKIFSACTGEEFSVQCRIIGNADFSAKNIEVFVGNFFEKSGLIPIFSDYSLIETDCNIISILIIEGETFIGFSKASENLCFNPDEYRILSRKGREISRAENKLKEAISKFGIKFEQSNPEENFALDMGAAPGGWSKVLADAGFIVFAVDPGELSPKLSENNKIRHFKGKIENYNFEEKFAVLVSDMNVEPQQAARIVVNLADNLKADGVCVVTLKLPFADVMRSISESVEILKERYKIVAIKNLTHNRREVTAFLERL